VASRIVSRAANQIDQRSESFSLNDTSDAPPL
jgi:hypothetical protein